MTTPQIRHERSGTSAANASGSCLR